MTQYDEIDGFRYDEERESQMLLPERRTILDLSGSLIGLDVLDLACGSGTYARILRRAGARRVVGVDISAKMLDVARRREFSENRGIEYVQADVAKLQAMGTFDLVTAVWLFNFARSRDELHAMFTSVSRQLPKGGRLVALTINPLFILGEAGWRGWQHPQLSERKLIDHVEFSYLSGSALITFCQWPKLDYEEASAKAGFSDFSWRFIEVPESLLTGPQGGQWRNFLRNPPMVAFSALKGSA